MKVFERDGYRPTSIDAIADAAGVSRRTIYHHFKTKNDILVAATLEQAHLFLEALEHNVAPSEDFPAFVVDCLCFVIRESPRSRFFMLQMARGVATESATIYFNHPGLVAEWLDYFREPYIESLRKGRINPAIDLGELLNWFGRVATFFLQYRPTAIATKTSAESSTSSSAARCVASRADARRRRRQIEDAGPWRAALRVARIAGSASQAAARTRAQ